MQTRIHRRSRRAAKASTQDVIGTTTARRVNRKWQKHYNHLLQLRLQLLKQRTDLSRDALEEQPAFSTHMADAATDTFDRDLALGMLSSDQDALIEIDSALFRIINGTYGLCELTGKPIEPARLAAIPWARFTTAAERKLEAKGALRRARLGPRETVGRG